MGRYVAILPPRTVRASDDWWPEPRESFDVLVTDDRPIDTGLVDQHGTPIMRLSDRSPLGFCR